ncbi:hypothetical protein Tco_1070539 [Tanacetum coccineum]|uniref:Uncharacterized protein n=1 Tax=Tanacetum coccineum TaxID=301880 RepID=A0ABQ5HNE2_9ASTR
METVNRSDPNIQLIQTFPTRRTSPQHFETSLNAILVALFNSVLLGLAVDLDEVMRHADNIIYAFRTLRQRIQQRKYPANLKELWPYIGVPPEAVSDDLGVTVNLLQERLVDNGMLFWLAPSNDAYILLGLQCTRAINAVNNEYEAVRVRHTTIPRIMLFEGVRQRLRDIFQIGNKYEVHADFARVRYGPLLTDLQWHEVLEQEEVMYKVNLLIIHN